MPVRTPYYNLHQITTGLYTHGGEYILSDGTGYVGEYHLLPNNQKFTESRPSEKSVELFAFRFEITDDSLKYNKVKKLEVSKYVDPILQYPIPTNDDYERGWIQRYFVQKRNSQDVLVEVDQPQFTSVNTRNNPGINGALWSSLLLDWKISRMPKDDIAYLNQMQIVKSENKFPGIGKYLTNPLEFWK